MKVKKSILKKVIPTCLILLQGMMAIVPTQICFAQTPDNVNTANSVINVLNKFNGPAIDDTLKNNLQGVSPIKFHMDVSPGNYDVTVELGDITTSAAVSVQGEARRAMIGEIDTPAGKISRQTFTINVRDPEAQPTGEGGTGTSGLDLTFSGQAPKVCGIGVAPAKDQTMVYIAGDSTVCDRIDPPYAGWGK